MKITKPLKYSGGKHYMAKTIHELAIKAEPYLHRVIPFFGSGSEFWEWKHEGVSEVINDIDDDIINFYKILKDPVSFADFQVQVSLTPFSRSVFNNALSNALTPVERAVSTFVKCRQSMAAAGRSFAPTCVNRVRNGMNANVSAYLSAIDGLEAVHERLRKVLVENLDFRVIMKKNDGASTLFYLDPPYCHNTRQSKKLYKHEMTEQDHIDMLDIITDPSFKSKVILSGYDNILYKKRLNYWGRLEKILPNQMSASSTKDKETEVLWYNF